MYYYKFWCEFLIKFSSKLVTISPGFVSIKTEHEKCIQMIKKQKIYGESKEYIYS